MRRINTPQVQQFEQDHISAVRALAPECMVLLKKDGSFGTLRSFGYEDFKERL